MAFVSLRAGLVTAVLVSISVSGLAAQAPKAEGSPAASPVSVHPNGTVSVKAADVAVQTLLEALEPVCPIQLRLSAGAAGRAVSIDVQDLPPAAAVGAVLKASDLDFAMHTTCGTADKPALVIVREAGTGRMVEVRPAIDPDDPRVKRARLEGPPLPPAPTQEPEAKEDGDKAVAGGVVGSETRDLAPGEVTGAQMIELLAVRPAAGSKSPVIELPFTDANGQPVLQIRPPKSPTMILPFPDANGNLVEVPVPTGPRAKSANFPVINPSGASDSGDKPAENAPGAATPAGARRPGGGGSDR